MPLTRGQLNLLLVYVEVGYIAAGLIMQPLQHVVIAAVVVVRKIERPHDNGVQHGVDVVCRNTEGRTYRANNPLPVVNGGVFAESRERLQRIIDGVKTAK